MGSEVAPGAVTLLLRDLAGGRREALDELVPLVYRELRRIAAWRVAGERAALSLQPTDLVHEAFLRLLGGAEVRLENRAHFFSAAAEAMRRILIERARRRSRVRHGGELQRVEPHDVVAASEEAPEALLALDEALNGLEANDARLAAVVKLRYFAGLTVPETAEALAMSPRGVNRAWRTARAWLNQEMTRGASRDASSLGD